MLISVQASPTDAGSWLELVQTVEAAGFHGLYAPDHPGVSASPFVALAAAAAVTERIVLGTCVVNASAWEPIALASEVATLDVVSHGRAVLGVGAGHTPSEWTTRGLEYPSARDRVDRMIELVDATVPLLAGERVTFRGRHVDLVDAVLEDPRPAQDRVPLLVGGNGRRVLEFAGRHADVVGITGLARTLEDGHRHEVDFSRSALERTVELVRVAARDRPTPELEALVQVVAITDDAARVADDVAAAITGASASELLDAPFTWIGTVDEIRQKLERLDQEYGLRRYVIRARDIDAVRTILG